MKINEVEAQVGITKKNIRFYEEQGLLSPRRNSENGYRDYGEAEVTVLRQIKLMRKLGVPLEEIRRMQAGGTVGDGMRRHLVTLERDQRSLEQSIQLCQSLKDREERLEALDAAALLEEMEPHHWYRVYYNAKGMANHEKKYGWKGSWADGQRDCDAVGGGLCAAGISRTVSVLWSHFPLPGAAGRGLWRYAVLRWGDSGCGDWGCCGADSAVEGGKGRRRG